MGILLARYIASQIEQEKLVYSDVVKLYPSEVDDIDMVLKEDGMEHLIKKDN